MDYYEILGLTPGATHDEIVRAYRRQVLLCHPDQTGRADSSRFRVVQEAYETLSDPHKRTAYDAGRGSEVPVRIVRTTRRPFSGKETIREVTRRPRYRSSSAASSHGFEAPWEEFMELVRRVLSRG